MPLFGAAYAAPNKGTLILYCFRSPKALLNTPINGKIQGLFKAFEHFSSTFQGNFYFQGLFKTVLYIQVFFKPVQTLYCVKSLFGSMGSYPSAQGYMFVRAFPFIHCLNLCIIFKQQRSQRL